MFLLGPWAAWSSPAIRVPARGMVGASTRATRVTELIVGRRQGVALEVRAIESYLRRTVGPEASLIEARSLSQDELAEHKGFGYGEPILVRYRVNSDQRRLVLHTMAGDQFGHDRRADRVAAMIGQYDTFDSPRHVRALDLGFVEDGELVSGGYGEPFLVTAYADGAIYAHDLHALADADQPASRDYARVRAIASYISEMARRPATPAQYRRAIRDIVGGGEGIFGLRDAYSDEDPIATPARLERIVLQACGARERLRRFEHRATQTHGDLHPFNVVFDTDNRLCLLDRSRGGFGDIADDVTCMAINYLAFALQRRGSFAGALRALWAELWSRVMEESGDREILHVVPVFFAWRTLVLASPVWYPDTTAEVRDTLLRFAERLLEGAPFDPTRVDELLG